MKKRGIDNNRKKSDDIPQNVVVLVLMIAIIVSIMGTWMVLDTISNTSIPSPIQNKILEATTQGNVALNIEYDTPINQTNIEG